MRSLQLAALLALATVAAAQTPPSTKTPTIDQSLETFSVNAPQLSPDGKRVIYEQSRTNWENNSFDTELWIANADGTERHLLTVRAGSSSSASWSPDGQWIAFLSDRPAALKDSPSGQRQLYLMPADGGDAQQITKMEHGINGFEWAPDSKHIAFAAEGADPKTLKDRKDYFGDYHVIHADYQMTHLWLIEIPRADLAGRFPKPADPKQLTKDDYTINDFSFSPDGKHIAFSAQRDPDLISGFSADIYTVTVPDGAIKKIVDTPGPDGNPQWSPDGKQIAYETSNGNKYFFYTDQRLAVVPADGGTPQVLTADFDEDPGLIRWAPEGIYFSALQKMSSSLFLLDPATKAVKKIEMPGSTVAGSFSFSRDFKALAFRGSAENRFAEIYVSTLPSAAPVQITHASDQLSAFTLAHREAVQWKSGDGTTIEGVLYKPADFDAHKKYPLLVVIHGGPTGIDMPLINADRYYPIERFVARGALILRPNYRGSAGYGEAFRSLNVRNLGVGDYADVISGVDSLIAQGVVDKDRVGSMGWSEGGYISAFITASSNRFKAVSVGAGISDWTTYYANTDITPFTPQYLHATPWDDPEIYAKTSPIHYIAHAETPTLIQQGSNDRRVPVPNSFELRQALEDRGVPVKMVLYEGFGHGINKPKQQRAVMEENELWFNHYIFGDPLPASLTPVVPPKPVEK
ncbi:S9 family peptidase [Occallatibacter riparius]|uniref:S9 family peptidase n=1 Tax=Occallatibacter riparius TaxID=1002689 RepID=A0A9J7BWC4_9BACT|nr:S9 family peptidase [Occallatibacter riparius]UWZ85309.1 S9 family peptidase [Occallatibacter riparius]